MHRAGNNQTHEPGAYTLAQTNMFTSLRCKSGSLPAAADSPKGSDTARQDGKGALPPRSRHTAARKGTLQPQQMD